MTDDSIPTGGTLRFGEFELDATARELRYGAARTRLQDQPFEILRLLLERRGEVVTRDELSRRLWPKGTFVDFEHSLNAAVKRLRAALGDDADNPRFVETVPRRGYRFIARPEGDVRAAAYPGSPRRRLAVLPFANLSDDPGQDYFGDGLSEELIAELGRRCRGHLGVIARRSSMVFKETAQGIREIGRVLGADYVLEGSVRRDGDRVRIVVRLVEPGGETDLWTETYDRFVTDYFTVQADVAQQVARSLEMELLPDQRAVPSLPSTDSAVYQTYLKARYYWYKPADEGLAQATLYFEQVRKADPRYAPGLAGLARTYVHAAEFYHGVPRQALAAARAAALEALAIDSSVAEAHLVMGSVSRMVDWDWAGAEDAFQRAITHNPSSESAHRALSILLAARGRLAEAVLEAEHARELDPLCVDVGANAAWVSCLAGDCQRAMSLCGHVIDMDPDYRVARRLFGAAALLGGRVEEAVASLELALELAPDDPVSLSWLAHARAVSGERALAARLRARAAGQAASRYVSGYHLAIAHAGLGERDDALAELSRACEDRDPALSWVAVDPRLAPLRDDPRFLALVARVGLAVSGAPGGAAVQGARGA